MCADPITLSLIGAGIGAIGTLGGGIAKYQAGQYQKAVDDRNALNVQTTANQNELINRDKSTRDIASQAVALAGQGGRIDTGTPLLLLSESARNAELDALSIRNKGIMEGQGYRAQGKAAAAQGLNDLIGSGFSAASGLLGNANAMKALQDI